MAVTAPLLFSFGAVALGVMLASLPGAGARTLGPVRAFALSAAIAVVCLHLLPEAAERLGAAALLAFAAGLALPSALERGALLAARGAASAGGALGREGGEGVSSLGVAASRLAIEASYLGLLAHHVGDGVALQLFGGVEEPQLDVLVALASHTVPVSALVVLRFGARDGRRAGVARAAGLALASAGGVALSALVGAAAWRPFEPWVAAVVAGLLLHFIAHDLELTPPRTAGARLLDLGALALGVGITLAASHPHEGPTTTETDLRQVVRLAPYALLGLVAIVFLRRPRKRAPAPHHDHEGHVHGHGCCGGHAHDHEHRHGAPERGQRLRLEGYGEGFPLPGQRHLPSQIGEHAKGHGVIEVIEKPVEKQSSVS